MTDYSQLPSPNPIAPQHEEPWLRLPPWRVLFSGRVLLSRFNVAIVVFLLWNAFEGEYHQSFLRHRP